VPIDNLPPREIIAAVRALRDEEQGALKALRERRAMIRHADRAARQAARASPQLQPE
jgi:hypothetical protein